MVHIVGAQLILAVGSHPSTVSNSRRDTELGSRDGVNGAQGGRAGGRFMW